MSVDLKWNNLLSVKRLEGTEEGVKEEKPSWLVNSRIEAERDFDRVLFSAPARRLGDKTQVFPLEKNESVRNRLTHSHEVSNIARSIGVYIVNSSAITSRILSDFDEGACARINPRRAVPAVLATAGLAHDLGNPPFGHQGEEAIRTWINNNHGRIFCVNKKLPVPAEYQEALQRDLDNLKEEHKLDFANFEGNAQTIRTLTRLQVVKDNRGLNLTFGTLAALMKYTVPSNGVIKKGSGGYFHAASKKFGYFQSEKKLVDDIKRETGLVDAYTRHPLTHIMEACDDIAYLIVDAEDAIKKQIVSFNDLVSWIRKDENTNSCDLACWVIEASERGMAKAKSSRLSPAEVNDVSMQMFRANAITGMVSAVILAYEENYDEIMHGSFSSSLLEVSKANIFSEVVRDFDKRHAYQHRSVLEVELNGYNIIRDLLDMLWEGITHRESFDDLGSRRITPFARYAYGRISENYRRVFEGRLPSHETQSELPIRYRELQLLTDMIAGMTDQYAIDLHAELKRFY